jgi:rhamnogalacturonyl hydrolase YesR
MIKTLIISCCIVILPAVQITVFAQNPQAKTDANPAMYLMPPDYPVPYGKTTVNDIKLVLERIYHYLNSVTPAVLIDQNTNEEIKDYSKINNNAIFKKGDFRLISYEWGVTYAGMLNAGEALNDRKFTEYASSRLSFLADIYPYFKTNTDINNKTNPMRAPLAPHALDDAGAICAAMIKSLKLGNNNKLRPIIDNYMDYISTKEFRLDDGTLARNRPMPNAVWLDDLFMSVPALAQMGNLTGEKKYFDDAVRQILLFSQRLFVKEKGIYMHGWIQDMDPHPAFHWARANGWAFMAMAELLNVLPENHPEYTLVLEQFRAHAKGLAAYQSGSGFWHQLLDKNDSYLETSATAIFTYSFAKGINKGWLNRKVFGPVAILGWNAVSTKVNEKGQVEGTCVGTGMGFDYAFYYYRPVNTYAAHGYGPTILAGSEIIKLINAYPYKLIENAVLFE